MKQSQLMTIGTVVVVALILAAAIIIPRLGGGGGGTAVAASLDYEAQPVAGSRDAPVKVAVFFDFLCPHCATFSDTVTPVLKREFVEDGTAAIYFYNFPVVDPVRSRAMAIVGECVQQQGNDGFITIEPILLRSQRTLSTTDRAIELALQYVPALDAESLRTCVDDTQTAQAVDADIAAARELGLTGTPAVLVNGELVANPTLANLRSAIQDAAAE
ncbi:MAG TPA: thioredoxin domain-containing protein [Trueperaceae bacterium]|nr:thioredoxin domain-containing protein [Trueperaceae bacterium]